MGVTDVDRQFVIGELRRLYPQEIAHIEADALRSYAERHHGKTEGYSQRVDYGTGIEYGEACECGEDIGEDGCTERQQLLADADALEEGVRE